jgi:hypothetical protein
LIGSGIRGIVMIDRWFSVINLPMTFEQYEKLPRDAAYKYEYWDGTTRLTPRPKQYHALLELRPMEESPRVDAPERVRIRTLTGGDWDALPGVFSGAFQRVQPFASLSDADRLDAASQCLQNTRDGHDGPLVEPACFVADGRDNRPVGAILVTAMPDVDLTEFHDLRWKEAPPADWLERGLGRPHLTWIFVGPWHVGHGVGTALLAAASRELLARGYRELATTFLLGNDSSLLWHWRNGFRLLAYPGSMRSWRATQRTTPPAP